jgi:hypothetical protein
MPGLFCWVGGLTDFFFFFAQADPKQLSFWSPPPEWLELQMWATVPCHGKGEMSKSGGFQGRSDLTPVSGYWEPGPITSLSQASLGDWIEWSLSRRWGVLAPGLSSVVPEADEYWRLEFLPATVSELCSWGLCVVTQNRDIAPQDRQWVSVPSADKAKRVNRLIIQKPRTW